MSAAPLIPLNVSLGRTGSPIAKVPPRLRTANPSPVRSVACSQQTTIRRRLDMQARLCQSPICGQAPPRGTETYRPTHELQIRRERCCRVRSSALSDRPFKPRSPAGGTARGPLSDEVFHIAVFRQVIEHLFSDVMMRERCVLRSTRSSLRVGEPGNRPAALGDRRGPSSPERHS